MALSQADGCVLPSGSCPAWGDVKSPRVGALGPGQPPATPLPFRPSRGQNQVTG